MAAPLLVTVHDLLGHLYSDKEWEALCARCGRCCFESRWTGNKWLHTSIPCRYLDDFDRTCKVYFNRFQAQDDCIRVTPAVVKQGVMPPGCRYVEEYDRLVEEEHGGHDPRDRPPRKRRGRSRGRRRKVR
jgi:uncharacterized protein